MTPILHPETELRSTMAPVFHHLSYALFDTYEPGYPVMAARCPVTCLLEDRDGNLCLPEEAVADLTEHDSAGTAQGALPYLFLTPTGLGVVTRLYERVAGVGVYWHIHVKPRVAARLLNSGALGDPDGGRFVLAPSVRAEGEQVRASDEAAYDHLVDAWQAMEDIRRGLLSVNDRGMIRLDELARVVEDMAAFAGCGLTLSTTVAQAHGVETVACYRPQVLELLLLYIFTQVRTYGATRACTVELGTLGNRDGGNLSFVLQYVPESHLITDRVRDTLLAHFDRWALLGELNGLAVTYIPRPPHRPYERQDKLPPEQVALEWLTDPAVLPSGDLKHPARLRDE